MALAQIDITSWWVSCLGWRRWALTTLSLGFYFYRTETVYLTRSKVFSSKVSLQLLTTR